MEDRPRYSQIKKALDIFEDGCFWFVEYAYKDSSKYTTDKQKTDKVQLNIETNKKIFNWEDLVFNYLILSWYINKNDEKYFLTDKWKLLKANMNNLGKRIEYFIEDYPALGWWVVWWIIWALISKLF